jgi:hypothetical protein
MYKYCRCLSGFVTVFLLGKEAASVHRRLIAHFQQTSYDNLVRWKEKHVPLPSVIA